MPRTARTPERVARAKALGTRVRALREEAGLSREGLARLAGVSSETVRKIEQGSTASPELFTFAALMDHLNASIADVLASVRDLATPSHEATTADSGTTREPTEGIHDD